jgi:hypothetical protein
VTVPRATDYDDTIADEICERLIEGESMRQICADEQMPHRATVLRWMASNPGFAAKCAHARELQSDLMDDLVLETAHGCTPETAAADRVRIAAYQWRAAKLAPKKYGDRSTTHLVGKDDDSPIETKDITNLERAKALAALVSAAKAE